MHLQWSMWFSSFYRAETQQHNNVHLNTEWKPYPVCVSIARYRDTIPTQTDKYVWMTIRIIGHFLCIKPPLVHDWLAMTLMMLNHVIARNTEGDSCRLNKNTIKDLARLLPASSLHLGAVQVHRSGIKESPSVFQAMARFNIISISGVASQSRRSGCLVTSGHCCPSAADEEWCSLKRPSSTVMEAQ